MWPFTSKSDKVVPPTRTPAEPKEDRQVPPFTVIVTPPEPNQDPDVREPIHAFIRCVKANPWRFRAKEMYNGSIRGSMRGGGHYGYMLRDKVTGERFTFSQMGDHVYTSDSLKWMTTYETIYVVRHLEDHFRKFYNDHLDRKIERQGRRERHRLMRVYR